jgi:hypothetical protein
MAGKQEKFKDDPTQTPGFGEHFLKFCPKHCPCGYICREVIQEDGKWRCPPMRITGHETGGSKK